MEKESIIDLAEFGARGLLTKLNLLSGTEKSEVHFVGLGGAGCNALEHIHNKGVKAKYTCITSPERNNLSEEISFVKFNSPENKLFHCYWENQDTILADEIKDVFNSCATYILLAGLGSYAGTNLTKSLNDYLQKQNKSFLIICNLPFEFEGKNRKEFANATKQILQAEPGFICFELGLIKEIYGGDVSMKYVLEKANEHFYKIFKMPCQ